jgi:diacylglycerol kinase (ATP)
MTQLSAGAPLVVGINPTSGKGKAKLIAVDAVAEFRRLGVEVVEVAEGSDAELRRSLGEALALDHRALVVVGGDGVVHSALQVLRDFPETPLGIIPAGTGNDIARAVGLDEAHPLSAVKTIVQALDAPPRCIDLGEAIHDSAITRFGAVYSAGFDALVNERANRLRWPTGPSRYTVAMLLELSTLTPRHYRLTIDGEVVELEALLVAVANAESFGGGMRIVPDTPIDDGLLQVFTVSPVSRLEFVRLYPRVFSGKHVTHPAVTIRPATRVRIEVDDIVGYADGERVGELPVELRVVPGGLRILA